MVLKQLQELIKKYNIPDTVTIKSYTGWECSEMDVNGAYYNETDNLLILVPEISEYIYWDTRFWEKLKSQERDYSKELEYYKKFKAIVI